MSKVTMATIKGFIRKNEDNLFIRFASSFDPTTDCVQHNADKVLERANNTELYPEHTLGISGAWFVGRSRDYIDPIADGSFTGYHIYNSCGSFDLVIRT